MRPDRNMRQKKYLLTKMNIHKHKRLVYAFRRYAMGSTLSKVHEKKPAHNVINIQTKMSSKQNKTKKLKVIAKNS